MKTSRPDGISQENRSHPFFILLRNAANEQEQKCAHVVKKFIVQLILTTVIPLFLFWASGPLRPTTYIAMGCHIFEQLVYVFAWRYPEMKRIIRMTCYAEVNQMIYSNDYQYQALNNEQLINTLTSAKQVLGELNEFERGLHGDTVRTILMAIGMLLILIVTYYF